MRCAISLWVDQTPTILYAETASIVRRKSKIKDFFKILKFREAFRIFSFFRNSQFLSKMDSVAKAEAADNKMRLKNYLKDICEMSKLRIEIDPKLVIKMNESQYLYDLKEFLREHTEYYPADQYDKADKNAFLPAKIQYLLDLEELKKQKKFGSSLEKSSRNPKRSISEISTTLVSSEMITSVETLFGSYSDVGKFILNSNTLPISKASSLLTSYTSSSSDPDEDNYNGYKHVQKESFYNFMQLFNVIYRVDIFDEIRNIHPVFSDIHLLSLYFLHFLFVISEILYFFHYFFVYHKDGKKNNKFAGSKRKKLDYFVFVIKKTTLLYFKEVIHLAHLTDPNLNEIEQKRRFYTKFNQLLKGLNMWLSFPSMINKKYGLGLKCFKDKYDNPDKSDFRPTFFRNMIQIYLNLIPKKGNYNLILILKKQWDFCEFSFYLLTNMAESFLDDEHRFIL